MEEENDSRGGGAGQFQTTQWDAILLAAQSKAPGGQAALEELCRVYWHPLYAFVRRVEQGPDDAKDLVQGFFLHLLGHKALRQVSPLKGKFRSFMLTSLQNYMSNEADRTRSQKRGGNVKFVSLEREAANEPYQLESFDSLPPEIVFDARWAITLLDEAMSRLRGIYASQGKTAILEQLKLFLDPLNNAELPSCDQLAQEIHVNAGTVRVLVHRLRKQYTALLREEVARTVCRPEEVDDEIHALCTALIAAEGRLDP